MKVIHKVLVGSRLYGLHRQDSDYDFRGVIITPLREKLYASAGNRHRKSITTDVTYYEFDHAMKLLQGGNPTMIETFFAPTDESNLPDFDPYEVIDFDQMVMSAKGFATSQIRQLQKHPDPKRRGKAIVSGLTGLSLIQLISQEVGWIPPSSEQIQLWRSIRDGQILEEGTKLLTEYINKDYNMYRWKQKFSSIEYTKDLILNTYMDYEHLGGEDFEANDTL